MATCCAPKLGTGGWEKKPPSYFQSQESMQTVGLAEACWCRMNQAECPRLFANLRLSTVLGAKVGGVRGGQKEKCAQSGKIKKRKNAGLNRA